MANNKFLNLKSQKGQRNKIAFEPIKDGDWELVNSLN